MTNEPKRTQRIRKQTAVLLSAIAATIQRMEKARQSIPFSILSTDPEWIQQGKDLEYNKTLLITTTDHYGTAKNKIKRQGTRLIRAGCASCGYTIRVSNMWIEKGLPNCPNEYCEKFGKPFEVDTTPSNKEFQTFEPDAEQPARQELPFDADFDRMLKESESFFTQSLQRKGKRK